MIAYHQLLSAMLKEIPELRLPCQRLKEEWRSGETPGPHVVLADAVVPFLADVLDRGHSEVVDRALAFAERAVTEGDDGVFEAIAQSLLEPMEDRPKLRQYALQRLGPRLRALVG